MWTWWLGAHCSACRVRLAVGAAGPWCAACAIAAERALVAADVAGLPVWAGWLYGGAVVAAVGAAKAGEPVEWAGLLGPLRTRLDAALRDRAEDVWLVAVPPQRQRLIERGLHLPDLLAGALSKHGRRVSRALERRDRQAPRRTERGERPDLVAVESGRGRRAIVVDDVVTTGTTLGAACEALQVANWHVLGCAVLADVRPAVVGGALEGLG